jgi:hypothetical protein
MKKKLQPPSFITAPLLGFLFLIPLIILEVVNRWQFNERFPVAMYTFAWVLQTAFVWILMSIMSAIRSKKSLKENPIIFLFRFACLAFIAYIWFGWIIDQWPCLMGIPHCD